MKSGVVMSLLSEPTDGPYVLQKTFEENCQKAAELGFEAVEIFYRSPDDLDVEKLRKVLNNTGLKLSALSTGGGSKFEGLSLCSNDPAVRERSKSFVRQVIDKAADLGAFTIIGLIQGVLDKNTDRAVAEQMLADALNELAQTAARHSQPIVLEPLNRYETNFINTLEQGVDLIKSLSVTNVKLLADFFHMNIEESSICEELKTNAAYLGHIHLVDNNRRPPGCGSLDFASIGKTLKAIGYKGYIAAECLPWPDSEKAAISCIECFRKHFS